LGDPVGRIMFIRQFYNLFHMLERDEDAEDTQNEIEKLQDEIEQQDLKSLYTEEDINHKGKGNVLAHVEVLGVYVQRTVQTSKRVAMS
jgi:hypothetical protein